QESFPLVWQFHSNPIPVHTDFFEQISHHYVRHRLRLGLRLFPHAILKGSHDLEMRMAPGIRHRPIAASESASFQPSEVAIRSLDQRPKTVCLPNLDDLPH